MEVRHDALNASCPNEEFYTTVPNDKQDRVLVSAERVGYSFQLEQGNELQKAEKAELKQSKNSILELKLVQYLQN